MIGIQIDCGQWVQDIGKRNAADSSDTDAHRFAERLASNSLFGRIVLTAAATGQFQSLCQGMALAAGGNEMVVEGNDLNLDQSLELLNAGASRILVGPAQYEAWQATIPATRLMVNLAGATPAEVGALANQKELWFWLPPGAEPNRAWPVAELPNRLWMAVDAVQGRPLFGAPFVAPVVAVFTEGNLNRSPEIIADYFFSQLVSDRSDALIPTIVVDDLGIALGLTYSSRSSLSAAIARREGIYWSRSRNALWVKGETSGARQQLLRMDADCDGDCLRFVVRQQGEGFCHLGTYSCFGADRNLATVYRRIRAKVDSAEVNSYSHRLARAGKLLAEKLMEEAGELARASHPRDVAWESADVIYFVMVAAARAGIELGDVAQELARRVNRLVRRD